MCSSKSLVWLCFPCVFLVWCCVLCLVFWLSFFIGVFVCFFVLLCVHSVSLLVDFAYVSGEGLLGRFVSLFFPPLASPFAHQQKINMQPLYLPSSPSPCYNSCSFFVVRLFPRVSVCRCVGVYVSVSVLFWSRFSLPKHSRGWLLLDIIVDREAFCSSKRVRVESNVLE